MAQKKLARPRDTDYFETVVQTAGETYQKTDMGFQDSKSNIYVSDGSTSTEAVLVGTDLYVASTGRPQAVISKAGKDDDSTASATVLAGTHLLAKVDGSQAIILSEVVKGETYKKTECNTYREDGSTSTEEILAVTDSRGSQTVISKAGKGETLQRTGTGCLDSETNTYGCNLIVSQAVIQIAGKVQGSSMECLPSDIVQDILRRVPAESVLECKLVCKTWVTAIRGSNFANMHLTRQLNHLHDGGEGNDKLAARVEPCLFFACRIDDPDEFTALLFNGGQLSDRIDVDEKYIYSQNLKRIYHPRMHTDPLFDHLVGSCNGLVCAFQLHHFIRDPIYICNPLTREYVYLPQLVVKKEDVDPDRLRRGEVNLLYDMACGFGYVRSTNEYKVVRIHYLKHEEGNVEVYTLGSGSGWRMIGKIPYRLDTTRKSAYVNDAIYWISERTVATFDLANEEFRLLSSVPPCLPNRKVNDRCGLVALGRHLCLYMDKLHMEIWSLMESRDSKETWHMEFDIAYEAVVGSRKRNFQPVLLTKKGEVIFLYAESVLYCYDPKTTILKMVSNKCTMENLEDVEVVAHVNTLASLEALGENSKRYTHELDRVALVDEEIDTTCFRLNAL